MRLIFLAAAATLALAACGKNNQVGQNQNDNENMSAESIVANDVTAIDAVTGDAANMAADVNYAETENLLANSGGNSTRPSAQRPSAKPAPGRPPDEPAGNTSAPTNATE